MTDGHHFLEQADMPEEYRFTLSNEKHDLHFWRVVLPEGVRDRQEIESYVDSLSQQFTSGNQYIIAASNHYGTSHFLDEIALTGKLTKKAERLYQVRKKE